MSTMNTKPTPSEILDEVSHHAAEAAVAARKTTKEDREWSRALGARLDARLAELRRNLTPPESPVEQLKPIRPSTLAMARDVVIAAIEAITRSMTGPVQVAHRNLTQLSDDDLRRLYDLIDPTAHD